MGAKVSEDNSSGEKISFGMSYIAGIIAADPERRKILFQGFGPSNGAVRGHLLEDYIAMNYEHSLDEMFAKYWTGWLNDETKDMANGDAEVVAISAYEVFAAALDVLRGKGAKKAYEVKPSSRFEGDLGFDDFEADVSMRAKLRYCPDDSVTGGVETVEGLVRKITPVYRKKIADMSSQEE